MRGLTLLDNGYEGARARDDQGAPLAPEMRRVPFAETQLAGVNFPSAVLDVPTARAVVELLRKLFRGGCGPQWQVAVQDAVRAAVTSTMGTLQGGVSCHTLAVWTVATALLLIDDDLVASVENAVRTRKTMTLSLLERLAPYHASASSLVPLHGVLAVPDSAAMSCAPLRCGTFQP